MRKVRTTLVWHEERRTKGYREDGGGESYSTGGGIQSRYTAELEAADEG